MKRLLFGLLLMFPLTAVAQQIYVDASTPDLVGQSFVFAFKQHVQASASYKLLDSAGNGITVQIISVDVGNGEGNASAISVLASLPLDGAGQYVLYHNVLLVGRDRVNDMSNVLLAGIDSQVSATRAMIEKAKKLDNTQHFAQPAINKMPQEQ